MKYIFIISILLVCTVFASSWYNTSFPFKYPITIYNNYSTSISNPSILIENPIFDESELFISYHFEIPSQMAMDTSGRNNHGLINGSALYVEGYENKGLKFDGFDDFIDISNISELNSPILSRTVIFWIFPEDVNNLQVIYKEGNLTHGAGLYIANGKVYVIVYSGNNVKYLSTNISKNEWQMVAYVFDYFSYPPILKLYVNGHLRNSTYVTFFVPQHSGYSSIGYSLGDFKLHNATINDCCHFKGIIDEVRFYNKSLSDNDIYTLYTFKAKLNYFDVRFTVEKYKRYVVTIYNPNPYNLTDYQLKIDLTYIPINKNRLKIYDENSVLIPYCFEQANGACNETASNIIWIRVTIPAGGYKRIYLEEDFKSATSGDNVFDFYDDFLGFTLNTSKWTIRDYTGSGCNRKYKIVNGFLYVYAYSSNAPCGYEFISNKMFYGQRYIWEVGGNWSRLDYYRGMGDIAGFYIIDSGNQRTGLSISIYGSYYNVIFRWIDDSRIVLRNVGEYSNGIFKFKYIINSNYYNLSLAGRYSAETTFTSNVITRPYRLSLRTYMDYWTNIVFVETYYDWVRVRKYAEIEPIYDIEPDISSKYEVPIDYERKSDKEFLIYLKNINIKPNRYVNISLYFGNPNAMDLSRYVPKRIVYSGGYDTGRRYYDTGYYTVIDFGTIKTINYGWITLNYYDSDCDTWRVWVYCDDMVIYDSGWRSGCNGFLANVSLTGRACKVIKVRMYDSERNDYVRLWGSYYILVSGVYSLPYNVYNLEKNIIINFTFPKGKISSRFIEFNISSNAKIVEAFLELNDLFTIKNITMNISKDRLKAYYRMYFNCNESYTGLYLYRYYVHLVCNTINFTDVNNFTLLPSVEMLWKVTIGRVSISIPTYNKTVMKFSLRACGGNITVKSFTFNYLPLDKYNISGIRLKIYIDLLNRESIQDPDSYYIQITDSLGFNDTILTLPVRIDRLSYAKIPIGENKTFAVVIDIY